jgi:hypothetical protein
MFLEQKICYMFNKFFSSFIKELKTLDESLKATIKQNYKVIDKSSDEYYNFFWGNLHEHIRLFIDEETQTNEDTMKTIETIEIIQGITIGDAMKVLKENDLNTFWNYVNILIIFAYLYTEFKNVTSSSETEPSSSSDDKSPAASTYLLFVKIVRILSMIQSSQDPTDELEDIIDDDVKCLVRKIKVFETSNADIKIDEATDTLPTPPAEFLESIENSKIANLAKEISKEIDMSSFNIESPADVAKLMDFSGSNNFLGNIVSKVSTKLTEKISSGEIKQEDLLSEAMSMMNMLNSGGGGAGGAGGIADLLKGMGGLGGLGGMLNNPMMSEMMKMAKKGKVATKNTGGARRSSGSTRDRLRKKFDEKKKKEETEKE